jgi:hypothetical protein
MDAPKTTASPASAISDSSPGALVESSPFFRQSQALGTTLDLPHAEALFQFCDSAR